MAEVDTGEDGLEQREERRTNRRSVDGQLAGEGLRDGEFGGVRDCNGYTAEGVGEDGET